LSPLFIPARHINLTRTGFDLAHHSFPQVIGSNIELSTAHYYFSPRRMLDPSRLRFYLRKRPSGQARAVPGLNPRRPQASETLWKQSPPRKAFGMPGRGGQRYDRSDSGPPVHGFRLGTAAGCAWNDSPMARVLPEVTDST